MTKIRLTRAQCQDIVTDYASRHGGYDAEGFMREVESAGEKHPAWHWFTWDDTKAASEYRVWEARRFVTGLRVSFSIETIGRSGGITISYQEAPLLLSDIDQRRFGGGYNMLDTDDADQMAGYCEEAASALKSWLHRYRAAVAYAGGSVSAMEKQLALLRDAASEKETETA